MSKIPGFRSGKKWKKIVAVIGYVFIFLIIINAVNDKDAPTQAPTGTAPSAQETKANEGITDADKDLLKQSYSAFSSEQRTQFGKIEEKYSKLTDTERGEFKTDFERLSAEKTDYLAKAAYQDWITGQFSVWDGSHTGLVKLLKENLNDPKSFQHVETTYKDNGDHLIVKMTYRAKNAYGGLILQNITAKADYKTNTINVISQND